MIAGLIITAFEIQAYARTTQSSFFPKTSSDIQTSSVLATVTASQYGPDPTFGHFESHSEANFSGTLKGFSSVTNNSTGFLPGLVTESTAHLYDNLTVMPPPNSPSLVVFTTSLNADGIFSGLSGAGEAYGVFSLSVNGAGSYFVVSCGNPCTTAAVLVNPGVTVIATTPSAWKVHMAQTFMVALSIPFDVRCT